MSRRWLIGGLGSALITAAAIIVFDVASDFLGGGGLVRVIATGALQGGVTVTESDDYVEGGLPVVMGVIEKERAGVRRTILLDAGNTLFRDAQYDALSARLAEEMSRIPYDAMTLGYRDFEIIRAVHPKLKVDILGCNAVDQRGEIQFKRSKLIQRPSWLFGDVNVLVIGVLDPDIPNLQDATDLQGFLIGAKPESLKCIRDEILANAGKADTIIILSSSLDATFNEEIAGLDPDIALVVGIGDSVLGTDKVQRGVRILGPAWSGKSVGEADISGRGKDARVIRATLAPGKVPKFPDADDARPSLAYRSLLRDYQIQKDKGVGADFVIGRIASKGGLPRAVENGVQLKYPYWSFFPSAFSQFVVEAVLAESRTHAGQADGPWIHGALYNSGAFEAGLKEGTVRQSDLNRAIPYNNRLIEVVLTTTELTTVLTSNAMRERGMLAAAGIRYRWRYHDPRALERLEIEGPDGVYRTPGPLEEIRIVLPDFVITGGDNYLAVLSTSPGVQKAIQQLQASDHLPDTVGLVAQHIVRNSPITYVQRNNAELIR